MARAVNMCDLQEQVRHRPNTPSAGKTGMRNPKYNSAVTVTVYPSPYHGVNYEITPINSLDFSQSASLEVVALLNPEVIYVAPHATIRIKPSPMCPSHRTLQIALLV